APRFVIPANARPGLDVPLARFAVEQGRLRLPGPTGRKGASSVGEPRIATGHAPFTVTITPPRFVFSATVDTSVAGFRTTPSYVVTPAIERTPELQNVGAIGPLVSIG